MDESNHELPFLLYLTNKHKFATLIFRKTKVLREEMFALKERKQHV